MQKVSAFLLVPLLLAACGQAPAPNRQSDAAATAAQPVSASPRLTTQGTAALTPATAAAVAGMSTTPLGLCAGETQTLALSFAVTKRQSAGSTLSIDTNWVGRANSSGGIDWLSDTPQTVKVDERSNNGNGNPQIISFTVKVAYGSAVPSNVKSSFEITPKVTNAAGAADPLQLDANSTAKITTQSCNTNNPPVLGGPSNTQTVTYSATAPKTPYFFALNVSDDVDKNLVPACEITTGKTDYALVEGAAAGTFNGSVSLPLGESTFTCTAVDSSGLEARYSWKVNVTDQTLPTITASVTAGTPGLNGWYIRNKDTGSRDVTVSFECTDAESGIAPDACPAPVTVSSDTTGLLIARTVQDQAGNTSLPTDLIVKLDGTAPDVSPADVLLAGWRNTPLTQAFQAQDATSGLKDATQAQFTLTVSAQSSDVNTPTTAEQTIYDNAGNSTTRKISALIDLVAPVVTLTPTGTKGTGAWYRSAVSFTASGNDALSAGVTCVTPEDLSTEVAVHSVTAECRDLAGNIGKAAVTLGTDWTKPTLVATRTPFTSGMWNNADVTVSFQCDDALSGVNSCSTPTTLRTEGAHQEVVGEATDAAGNSASLTVNGINIDKTAPSAVMNLQGTSGIEGWFRGTVKATTSGTDALSQVQSCTADQVFADETDGTLASGTCTDAAGNVSMPATATVKLDNTAPLISGSADQNPNGNGWYKGDVNVTFTCSDARSGVDGTCPIHASVSGEGRDLTVTRSVADRAGNQASATVSGINIDRTAPVITAARTPAPNAQGWNNTPVNVTFTCSDALSGTVTCTAPTELGQGAGQTLTGTATDQAGNDATVTVKDINVDLDKPLIEAKLSAAANAAGWFKQSVTATFTCSDVLSGILNCSAPYTFIEGDEQGTAGTATDRAGNASTATVSGVKVDLTDPSFTAPFTTLYATSLAGATLDASSLKPADALSGVASATCRLNSSPTGGAQLTLPIGVSAVTCTVTDNAGRAGTLSGNVTVTFAVLGTDGTTFNLLAPLKNTPADLSLVKLGSTVPLKFLAPSYVGGTPATDLASGLRLSVNYRGNLAVNDPSYEVTETATGSTVWRYESGQYIFNLSTKSGYKAGTYDVEIRYNGLLIAKGAFNVKP